MVVLTRLEHTGVCPAMCTAATNDGHVPVDMALKNPHVQAAWTCAPIPENTGSQTLGCSWRQKMHLNTDVATSGSGSTFTWPHRASTCTFTV